MIRPAPTLFRLSVRPPRRFVWGVGARTHAQLWGLCYLSAMWACLYLVTQSLRAGSSREDELGSAFPANSASVRQPTFGPYPVTGNIQVADAWNLRPCPS